MRILLQNSSLYSLSSPAFSWATRDKQCCSYGSKCTWPRWLQARCRRSTATEELRSGQVGTRLQYFSQKCNMRCTWAPGRHIRALKQLKTSPAAPASLSYCARWPHCGLLHSCYVFNRWLFACSRATHATATSHQTTIYIVACWAYAPEYRPMPHSIALASVHQLDVSARSLSMRKTKWIYLLTR